MPNKYYNVRVIIILIFVLFLFGCSTPDFRPDINPFIEMKSLNIGVAPFTAIFQIHVNSEIKTAKYFTEMDFGNGSNKSSANGFYTVIYETPGLYVARVKACYIYIPQRCGTTTTKIRVTGEDGEPVVCSDCERVFPFVVARAEIPSEMKPNSNKLRIKVIINNKVKLESLYIHPVAVEGYLSSPRPEGNIPYTNISPDIHEYWFEFTKLSGPGVETITIIVNATTYGPDSTGEFRLMGKINVK